MAKTTIISGLDKHTAQREADFYNASHKDAKPFKVDRCNVKPQNKRPVWKYAVITYSDDPVIIASARKLASSIDQD